MFRVEVGSGEFEVSNSRNYVGTLFQVDQGSSLGSDVDSLHRTTRPAARLVWRPALLVRQDCRDSVDRLLFFFQCP